MKYGYLLDMPSREEKLRKRIKHLFKFYIENRADLDIMMEEL